MRRDGLKPFGNYLEELAYRKSRYDVFDDFLTMIVCALSMGRKEDEYLRTVKDYTREELDLFCQAFASVVIQMEYNPLVDPFGDYFEEFLSNGKNGQFFTPNGVCDLMASIVAVDEKEESDSIKTVYDPTCGSGRLLLSAAKKDRKRYFIGCDISAVCCKMTLINMCLNSLQGEVYHMDTLAMSIWRKWLVIVPKSTKIPYIYEVVEQWDSKPPLIMEVTEPIIVEEVSEIKPLQITDNQSVGFVRFSMKT